MKFEVWMEGYRATGESAPAHKVGEVEAPDFAAACDALCGAMECYDRAKRAVWACRLFDNETDAQRSFG